jgi:hypothetical protein
VVICRVACLRWRQDNPEEWEIFEEDGYKDQETKEVITLHGKIDVELFWQGMMTNEGQGDFDFPDREVERYAVGYRGYHGE